MKILNVLLVTTLALSSTILCAQEEGAIINAIAKEIDLCVHNNRHGLNDVKDCGLAAEQTLAKYQNTSQQMWAYAGMIRRKLGNNYSLKYYNRALKDKDTSERCIDDGLDAAVKSGLALSAKIYELEVSAAKEIVFKHCWAEFKEEIVVVTNSDANSILLKNVCSGAKNINAANLFPKCS